MTNEEKKELEDYFDSLNGKTRAMLCTVNLALKRLEDNDVSSAIKIIKDIKEIFKSDLKLSGGITNEQ